MTKALRYWKHFTLWELFVLGVSWWYRHVCFGLVEFDTVWRLSRSYRVADFVAVRLVPFLLLEWLAWAIAKDCIRAVWQIEDERRRS